MNSTESSSSSGGTSKTAVVTLSDGRTVTLRPIRGRDYMALSGGIYEEILLRLEKAVISKSWEGDLLEEEMPVLTEVLRGWRVRSEESAVPPESGEASQ